MLSAQNNSKLDRARRQFMTVGGSGRVQVVKVQIPGIQGPRGEPGKDGNAVVDSIASEQIKNLFGGNASSNAITDEQIKKLFEENDFAGAISDEQIQNLFKR